jgi:hypothetical protein
VGDLANVQAVTRVNAEQSPKRVMQRPTCLSMRGRLPWLGVRATRVPSCSAGVLATACTSGMQTQHGKPCDVDEREVQPDAREGQAGHCRVTEGLMVPMKPGNAGGGTEPWFKATHEVAKDRRLDHGPGTSN